jgi:CheY-like chemotaxis protein
MRKYEKIIDIVWKQYRKKMDTNKTVLVVDDSRVSRMITRHYIVNQHSDWIIEEAATGEEALERVASFSPRLILIDVNMPGMGGVAAAEQLCKLCPQAHISLLTANVQSATRKRAAELGIGFLEKPVSEERIHHLLASLES